jgi:hypothetical protein
VTPDDLLGGLTDTLGKLADIVTLGRSRYDSDPFVRLSLQRLWITAGNYADAYRTAVGLPSGHRTMVGDARVPQHPGPHAAR